MRPQQIQAGGDCQIPWDKEGVNKYPEEREYITCSKRTTSELQGVVITEARGGWRVGREWVVSAKSTKTSRRTKVSLKHLPGSEHIKPPKSTASTKNFLTPVS